MSDLSKKSKKFSLINIAILVTAIFLVIFGVVCLVIGIKFNLSAVETKAIIVDIYTEEYQTTDSDGYSKTSQRTIGDLKYTVDGVDYEAETELIRKEKNSVKIGDEYTIYYSSTNPKDYRIKLHTVALYVGYPIAILIGIGLLRVFYLIITIEKDEE